MGLRGEVMEARPENRAWPPKAAPFGSAPTTKKEEDAKTKENIGRLRTYFAELEGLPTHIKTCSNCNEKGVYRGVGDDPGQPSLCWCVARRRLCRRSISRPGPDAMDRLGYNKWMRRNRTTSLKRSDYIRSDDLIDRISGLDKWHVMRPRRRAC